MNDYISREAAIDYVKAQRERMFTGCTIEEGMEMMIREVPAADVVEVIRCENCKYYNAVVANCSVRGWKTVLIRNPKDYCSRAERRTDDNQ